MNKTTFILLFALLTTQHTYIKSGMITNIAVAAVIAAASIFAYNKLQESQKNNVDKIIDAGADAAKSAAKSAQDFINKK
jgi:high-affinity Fe2+/Pb2+ permease